RRDADHDPGGGDDAVVRAEHAGSQPVQLLLQTGAVRLTVVVRLLGRDGVGRGGVGNGGVRHGRNAILFSGMIPERQPWLTLWRNARFRLWPNASSLL